MPTARRLIRALAALVPATVLLTGVTAGAATAPASAATCARIPSDFNGDGYADLAIGEQDRNGVDPTFPGLVINNAGAVRVLYGGANGPTATGNQYFDFVTDRAGFGGSARIGAALASGYFNDDCAADLAVGSQTGVVVLYGSTTGLRLSGLTRLTTAGPSPIDLNESGLGSTVAAADINGDGRDDLAVGAPSWSDNRGGVGAYYATAAGLTAAGSQWFTQDSPGIPGAAEHQDLFGRALAAADFTGDGFADLAIGAPWETLGSVNFAGGIVVLRGSAAGLVATGSQWWDQGSAGVPDSSEPADFFGGALAAGDVDGGGRADLAVGASNETINKRFGAGAVTVFRGASAGLTTTGIAQWHQDSPGVPGVAEGGDSFGTAVAFGDVNGDRLADLVVGSPIETIAGVNYTGSVTVLYGRRTMLTGTGSVSFSQNSAGVPGANEDTDWFGQTVRTIRAPGKAYDSVVVASLNEGVGTVPEAGAITVLRSGTGGVTGAGATFFSGVGLSNGASPHASFGWALG